MIRGHHWRRLVSRIQCFDPTVSRSVYTSQVDLTRPGEPKPKGKKRQKIRLDEYLIQQYPQHSPGALRAWIACRKVAVNRQVVDKAGTILTEGQYVTLNVEEARFVSRAGYKLDAAIQHFKIDVKDKYCLDAGIGTGGFTDCLLQYGAAKVYGVDVGYGDVDYNIRVHPKVQLIERTNIRYLDPTVINHAIDLVTLDLSFISVLKVIPIISEIMDGKAELVVLIKPQYEAQRKHVKQGGIVDDPVAQKEVIDYVKQGIEDEGFECMGVMESPLRGKDSENTEYLSYYRYS